MNMNNSNKKTSSSVASFGVTGKCNKTIGVRRVQVKAIEDNNEEYPSMDGLIKCSRSSSHSKYCYPHGEENLLIQHLLSFQCNVLRRILFTRNPLDSLDYVAEEWKSNNVEIKNRTDLVRQDEQGSEESEESDDISFFLRDVIEENKKMNWKKNDSVCFYSDEVEQEEQQDIQSDTNVNAATIKGARFDSDEILWLTKEMERDWKEFLENQDALYHESIATDTRQQVTNDDEMFDDSNAYCGNEDPIELVSSEVAPPKYKYKASIALSSHGRRCDLGTYDTPIQAATEYDKFAYARQTLGRKLLEEFDIRRRVYARRAAYLQTKRVIIDQAGEVSIAASKASSAAAQVLSSLKPEGFLISDRVLSPELNFSNDEAVENYDDALDQMDNDDTIPIGKKLRRSFETLTNEMLYSDKPQTALLHTINDIETHPNQTTTVTSENELSDEERTIIQNYISTHHQLSNHTTIDHDDHTSIQNKLKLLTNQLKDTANDIEAHSQKIANVIKLENEYNTNILSKEKEIQKRFCSVYKALLVNRSFSSPWKQSCQV